MNTEFQHYTGTKVVFGQGQLQHIMDELSLWKSQNPYFLIDKNLIEHQSIKNLLTTIGVDSKSIYVDLPPDPDIEVVEKAFALFAKKPYDSIVAIGGGSTIDVGKIISLLATNEGEVTDYEGRNMFKNFPIPLLAVPTTIGTGSEMTMGGVITDKSRMKKMVIAGFGMASNTAILDPNLLDKLPPSVVAISGMDALSHAIEAYISRRASFFTDILCLEAIRTIFDYIRPAYSEINNIEAKGAMLYASCIAGMAFGNALLGLTHAMSHPISVRFDTPHGLTNSILLPYVLEFNRISCSKKLSNIANILNIPFSKNIDAGSKNLISAILELTADLDLPSRFKDLGTIDESNYMNSIDTMASETVVDTYAATNPRTSNIEQIKTLFYKAYNGK